MSNTFDELEHSMSRALDPRILAAAEQGLGSKFLEQAFEPSASKEAIAALKRMVIFLEGVEGIDCVPFGLQTGANGMLALQQFHEQITVLDQKLNSLTDAEVKQLAPWFERYRNALERVNEIAAGIIKRLEIFENYNGETNASN